MTESPDDIIGHKSFDTGERDPATGLPLLRHEPLTRREADVMIERGDNAKKKREADWPAERDAILAMWEAWQRLIARGLVRGIIHTSIRKQSGAAIRATALWPLDGGGAE